jgi:hypothetical protein
VKALQGMVLPALLVAACFMARAEDFQIKLERPNKAGDKYGLVASGSQQEGSVVMVGDKVAQKKDSAFTTALEANVTVISVSDKGQPTGAEFAITQFTMKKGDQALVLVPPGQVLVMDRTKKPAYSLKEGTLSAEALAALNLLMPGGDPATDENDDEIYGTSARQTVGGQWNIDTKKAVLSLQKKGIGATGEGLSGSGKLLGVEKAGGLDCLKIACTMYAKNVMIPLPPPFKMESSTLQASLSGLFPQDVTKPRLAETGAMQMQFVGKGKANDQEVTLTVTMAMSLDRKITPAAK